MVEARRIWDAVIVGAGPAGSALAARLARAGHEVLLLDREPFPRPKPCGECVNPAALAALESLGVRTAVAAEPHGVLRGWRIAAPSGESFDAPFPVSHTGLAMQRALLDRVLLDHARACGAQVATGVRVTDVVSEGARVTGVRIGAGPGEARDVRARLTVGADGLRSVVSRRLGLVRRAPKLRKLALTAHVEGIDTQAGIGELHVTDFGCVGVAGVGGGLANVTVVVAGDARRAIGGDRDAYFDAALREILGGPPLHRVDEVLSTGPFDWPVRRAVEHGALLVGDAAGYYDPFTGQGIFRALRGAELAAAAALPALARNDCSLPALMSYERARRRAFDPGTRLQHVIEFFLARRRLFEPTVRLLQRRPGVADALIAVAGDIAPVRTLLQPRMLTALLRGSGTFGESRPW
jgi:menaquinone-9 beta-reductase